MIEFENAIDGEKVAVDPLFIAAVHLSDTIPNATALVLAFGGLIIDVKENYIEILKKVEFAKANVRGVS